MKKQSAHGRLNILLIVTDQQTAYRDIPGVVPLPHQERLRAAGIEFENFHVNTAPCGPSRSVMYTGQHTQKTRVIANPNSRPFPEMSPDIATIGDMLRACGYTTHYKGKWHLSLLGDQSEKALARHSREHCLEPYGFSDYNLGEDPHGLTWTGFREDPITAAEAVGLLARLAQRPAGDSPWFLAVNLVNPHDIMFFDATGRQEETRLLHGMIAPLRQAPCHPLYRQEWDAALPESFADDLADKPAAHREALRSLDAIYGELPREDEAAWRRRRSYYFNCLRDMDAHLGAVLEALEDGGEAERTIVVFTSDHGELGGAHGLRQKGNQIYKENLGVPFVVRHPDVVGGRKTAALGSAVDLAPTLLALAGDTDPGRWPDLVGVDLAPAVGTPGCRTKRDERGILMSYGAIYGWDVDHTITMLKAVACGESYSPPPSRLNRALLRGVHTGSYKFARYFAPADHHMPRTWSDLVGRNDLELYDLVADPQELHNLAAQPNGHKALILELNRRVNELIKAEIGADDGSEFLLSQSEGGTAVGRARFSVGRSTSRSLATA
jgi:arylsulfatase